MKDINNLSWLKLDNAATIYPSTLSRTYASMFRLTITLTEDIDNDILSQALKNIMNRFPTFNFTLKQGFFWCYFDRIYSTPKIKKDVKNPMLAMNFYKKNRYMFKVRTYKNRIAIEYFHALTDGTGAMTFMLSLTCEYLRLRYKIKPEYNDLVLNPKSKPTKEEIEDAFLKVYKSTGSLVHENKAFQLKGTKEDDNILNVITGITNLKELKKLSKKYKATITEFLVSIAILSIQELKKDYKKSKKDIKVSVPINLRKLYNIKTLRNFSSYMNVGISASKDYTLEEIISKVKKDIKEMSDEKAINAKISGNVKLMKNQFIRRIPMFIKKHVMSYIEKKMGDGYITTTLSNLGLISVPDPMKKYITDMNFILGKSRGKPSAITVIGYNNKIYITFSSVIKETDLERIFFSKLVDMGLNVYIESNR